LACVYDTASNVLGVRRQSLPVVVRAPWRHTGSDPDNKAKEDGNCYDRLSNTLSARRLILRHRRSIYHRIHDHRVSARRAMIGQSSRKPTHASPSEIKLVN
jgi:hypothetical protein